MTNVAGSVSSKTRLYLALSTALTCPAKLSAVHHVVVVFRAFCNAKVFEKACGIEVKADCIPVINGGSRHAKVLAYNIRPFPVPVRMMHSTWRTKEHQR